MNQKEKLIETTIQMLNNKLVESTNRIKGYRSISEYELIDLLNGKTIYGRFNNAEEKQTTGVAQNVVAFFTNPIKWEDSIHQFFIQCEFDEDEIIETGKGTYFASDSLSKTSIWTGRRGSLKYTLDEFYVSSYNINNITAWINTKTINIGEVLQDWANNDSDYIDIYEKYKQLNLPEYDLSQIKPEKIEYTQDEDTPISVYYVYKNKQNIPAGILKVRRTPNQIKGETEKGEYYFKTQKEAQEFLSKYRQ